MSRRRPCSYQLRICKTGELWNEEGRRLEAAPGGWSRGGARWLRQIDGDRSVLAVAGAGT
jgi:hypothetical protein